MHVCFLVNTPYCICILEEAEFACTCCMTARGREGGSPENNSVIIIDLPCVPVNTIGYTASHIVYLGHRVVDCATLFFLQYFFWQW